QAPQIHLTAVNQAGVKWLFALQDNGLGIEPADLTKVFQMFWRSHREADQNRGQGVGLTVCKRIVDRHGGQIWIESQPGQGATVYFTLQ
ncbi:MAG: histidine kinase, partial [Anaerolineae bacterium]|nr:histidine kinase [Anaerolineae bacterium]